MTAKDTGLRQGLELGRFRLVSPLGHGTFAEVWRADHRSGTAVAIKVAHRTSAGRSSLSREAVRLAELDHPGIVQVFDHGVQDGRPWLALELATGTLAAQESPLPLWDLTVHLLRALAHLHAHDVLHCDLKPSNILVGCAPRLGSDAADRAGVRLADFGIASRGPEDRASGGTPGFASPEQARGFPGAPHFDLYSLARVVEQLLGEEDGSWGPWLGRALHADPDARFPTAAHALAALPPRDATEGVVPAAAPQDAATRAVLAPLGEAPRGTRDPGPLVAPSWTDEPPMLAVRRPKIALVDTGLTLLPHRPAPMPDRMPLLLALWREAVGQGGPDPRILEVAGSTTDIEEVRAVLEGWAREVGRTLAVHRAAEATVVVPPLALSALQSRAEALGFEPVTALRLVRGCATWSEVRAKLLELIRADLVEPTDDGLAVGGQEGAPSTSEDLDARLDDAWWYGDPVALAEAIAELERTAPADPQRKHWQLTLARARLVRPGDLAAGERLAAQSALARDAGYAEFAEGLGCEAVVALNSARTPDRAVAILDALPSPRNPRIEATLELYRGYLLFQLVADETLDVLERAAALADGHYEVPAWSTICDWHGARGNLTAARQAASRAIEAIPSALPHFGLLAYLALVQIEVRAGTEEAVIVGLLDAAKPHAEAAHYFRDRARYWLFRAQSAMRQGRWNEADLLLGSSQALYSRHGEPATIVVLNHGLVALNRGDLGSVPPITPPDWLERIATAPPYVRPAMELHQLFVALGERADEAVERSIGWLEAYDPLPTPLHEPVGKLLPLVRGTLRVRLRSLIDVTPFHSDPFL